MSLTEKEKLEQAIQVGKVFADEHKDSQLGKSLRVLFELLQQDPHSERWFATKDSFSSEQDSDPGSQARNVFVEIPGKLDQSADRLAQIARDNDLDFIPRAKREKVSGRNRLRFFAVARDQYPTYAKSDVPADGVGYSIERRVQVPFYSRWLFSGPVGISKATLLALFLILLPLGYVGFLSVSLYGLWLQPSLLGLFFCIFWLGLGYALYPRWHSWWRFPAVRMKLLSSPLFGAGTQRQLLLLEAGEAGADGKLGPNRYSIVSVSAECPICKSKVYLSDAVGGTRVVEGHCSRNPSEHRFSFDFTTNLGHRLG